MIIFRDLFPSLTERGGEESFIFRFFPLTSLSFLQELLVGFFLHGGSYFLLQELEEDEEHGYGEEYGECADYHAADYAHAYGAVAVGSGSGGKEQGYHTEHTGEYGHQNGAQACLGSRVCGLYNAHAFTTTLQGELGNQDGCFGQ